MSPDTEALWSDFKAMNPEVDDSRLYEVFCFGDSEALADELATLVLAGKKNATAGSVLALEADNKAPPRPGDFSIVTTWAGEPKCIIKTQSIEVVKFKEVGQSVCWAAVAGRSRSGRHGRRRTANRVLT